MQRIKRTGLAICLSFLILGGYKESAAAYPAVYPTTSYLLEPAKTVQHHNLFEEVVEPLYQGQFISAGENRIFTIEINNTSFNSFDEFEFLVESIWPVQLLNQEGFALMDTDGDGLVESGPVAPQALLLLNAVVSAPAVANVGDYNEAAVTVYSSKLGIVVGKYILQNTIPAPFVQMYADYGLDNVFINFISPEKQTLETTGQADIYGFSPTLAGKDHFLVAWRRYHYANIAWNSDIEYSVFPHQGTLIAPQLKLTDNNQEILTINDFNQVADTNSAGLTGLFWYRSIYENFVSRPVNDLWFAILNADGTNKFSPQKLTSNSIPADQPGGKSFENTGIAAISDDRFVLTWVEQTDYGSETIDNVFYCVIDSNGDIVKPVVDLTGQSYDYHLPFYTKRPLAVTSLQNESAIIIYAGETNLFYSVVNRNGDVLKNMTDSGFPINNVDVVQLSGGNIFVAMPVKADDGWFNYFIIDQVDYEVIKRSDSGIPENSFSNQYTLSVSNDDSNHAILTWVSSYSSSTFEHLMYSLLDEQGNTVTPPVRFYQASLIDVMTPWIIYPLVASPNGYGNASFSQPVSGSAVDLFVSSQSIMLVNSGETVLVPIEIKNQGLSGATGVEFTVELDKELTYISDTSGMTPKISRRTLTWQVQNLDYLGRGSFDILLATTPSVLGTSFPVVLTISSSEADGFPGDNHFNLEIISSNQTYFPFVSK